MKLPNFTNKRLDYKENDSYYTPRWVFETLNTRFDLDVCAPKEGVPWLPADKHYSIEDDGLTSPWSGKVWMNPPYSKPTPWIEKFIDHGNGIALIQVSKSNAFLRMWNEMDAICFLPRNIMFEHKDEGKKGIFMPVALFAMGSNNVDILKRANINKVR